MVGDRPLPANRILYPTRPDRKPLREDGWEDAPARDLGPDAGVPAP